MSAISAPQERYLRHMNKVQPDFTMAELAGRNIPNLSSHEATAIITAYEAKFGKPKRKPEGEQKEEEPKNKEEKKKELKNPHPEGSKQHIIFEYLKKNDLQIERSMRAMRDDDQIGVGKPIQFSRNVGGGLPREPLPDGDFYDDRWTKTQYGKTRGTTLNIAAAMKKMEPEEVEDEQDEKSPPPPPPDPNQEFLQWIRGTVRPVLAKRNADGTPVDEWGMRQAEYGARLLAKGVPPAYLKHSATRHFPQELRKELGVKDYDPTKFKPSERIEGMHPATPLCLTIAEAGVPLALIGPKGTGKTTLARQIAEVKFGTDNVREKFGMVSMTNGTSPSAFCGRVLLNDTFISSKFMKIFIGGGVFLFDEMDAGAANLLLLLNAALANGIFENPVTGEAYEQHDDFIPVAGMNTLGLGSGRDYTGRNRLDAATLDRWSMGRVDLLLDEDLEERIFRQTLAEASVTPVTSG